MTLGLDSRGFTAEMGRASAASKQLRKDIADIQKGGGFDKMIGGMTYVGRGLEESARGSNKFRMGLDALAKSQGTVTSAAVGSIQGFSRTRLAIEELGFAAVGVQGKVGRIASFFLTMGVGGTATLAITAGLALIAFAYEKIAGAAQKAREEAEKTTAELVHKGILRADPAADIKQEIIKKKAERLDIRRQIAAAQSGDAFVDAAGSVVRVVDPSKVAAATEQLRLNGLALHELGASIGDVLKPAKELDDHLETLAERTARWAKELRLALGDAQEFGRTFALPAFGPSGDPWHNQLTRQEAMHQQAQRVIDAANEINAAAGGQHVDEIQSPSKLWEESWKNAVRGSQDSLAQFFVNLGKQGNSIVDLFRAIAQEIQNLFAQVAARSIINAIFPSVAGASGGGGGVGGGTTLASVGRAPSAGVTVHQNISFNVSALDGPSVAAMLRSQGGTIAGVVAQAASDAPAFARHLVAQGLR